MKMITIKMPNGYLTYIKIYEKKVNKNLNKLDSQKPRK